MKMIKTQFKSLRLLIIENKWILLIMLLLLAERLVALGDLGIKYSLESDDLGYVNSGFEFAQTGSIYMYGVLSAQIMPGMPVIIGFLSIVFGQGRLLWLVLKLLWITMGVLSAFFIYKSVTAFAPKWCGIVATLFLFSPDFVWMDNLLLTETPFMFFFAMMIYATIMMARSTKKSYFWVCFLSYFCALMLKANIVIYPLFALLYLLIAKYDRKLLVKQIGIVAIAVLLFVIPWSIRNYKHFDAFIPLTYGAGNPKLLGTYQGKGYPSDEELDYKTNVEQVAQVKFAKYYSGEGKLKHPYLSQYIALETDGIKANYRISEWIKRSPISFLKSYLSLKPRSMIINSFYWEEIFDISYERVISIRCFEWNFCLASLVASFLLKKKRKIMGFLMLLYMGNIFIYSMTFAFDRYAQTLLPIRFIMFGIGLTLVGELLMKALHSIKEYNKKIEH